MSGGQRYWNEETQRWEDGTQETAHATPPPPGRPDHEPTVVDGWGRDEGVLPPPAAGPPGAEPGSGAMGTPPASGPPGAAPGSGASSGPLGAPSPSEPTGTPLTAGPAGTPWPAGPAGTPRSSEPAAAPRPSESAGSPSTYGPTGTPPSPAASQPSPAPLPSAPPPAPWPSGPSWPPAGLPAAAAAGRFDRRRVWAAVVAGAAVVGITVGLVLTQMAGDGDDDGGRDHNAAESVTPTDPPDTSTSESPTGEAPEETSSPSLTAAGLPSGYDSFDDPEGFRTAVPEGWERDTVASKYGMDIVNFRSPDREQRIQVFQVAEATPQESFDLFLSPDTPKADSFRRLGREDLSDGDVVGERLEYLVDSIRGEPDVGTWHVVDTRFTASDGALYAVAVYGRDDDGRSDEVEMADTVVGWFCPPGGTCAG